MRAHLSRLVGTSIQTLSGRAYLVLGVDADLVWLGTDRSPDGKPVPVRDIQDAADRLFRDGEVEISVASVGHRSAFVGAALASLPGTITGLGPAWVRLP